MARISITCIRYVVLPLFLSSGASAFAQSSDRPDESESENAPERPGLLEVDEEAATRALERSLIQQNALLLAPGRAEIGLDFSFGYDARFAPGSPDLSDTVRSETTIYGLAADLRYGMIGDMQIELMVPLTSTTTDDSGIRNDGTSAENGSTRAGLGDLRISLLKTLSKEKGSWPDVIARLTYDADNGQSARGRTSGTGAEEILFGLNATRRQDPLVFTYGLSHTVAREKQGFKPGSTTQLSIGTALAASPNTSLRFDFDQVFVEEAETDGSSIEGSDSTQGILTIGASSVVSQLSFLTVAVSAGLTEPATDYAVSLGYSHRFGPSRP